MADSGRPEALFKKYLQRRCSPQELEELIELLYQAQTDQELEGSMRAVWDQLKDGPAQHDIDWNNMYESIRSVEEPIKIPVISRRHKLLKWYGIAASVLLLITVSVYLYPDIDTHGKLKPVVSIITTEKAPETIRQTIHLPDGSTVILNANSKLSYPASFAGNTREVHLTGEGFFDIKHNPHQPFLIHTGKLVTKVLGTAFNIKAYAREEFIEVTVTRGKVQVLKDNKSLALITPGQQVAFNTKTEEYAQQAVNVKQVVAWKPGEIFFDDITMEEATKRIEERFKVKIVFTNPDIKTCRVTATFSEDDLPEDIMAVICVVSKAKYSITDKNIMISGRGCN